jgi:hypothetical protein
MLEDARGQQDQLLPWFMLVIAAFLRCKRCNRMTKDKPAKTHKREINDK